MLSGQNFDRGPKLASDPATTKPCPKLVPSSGGEAPGAIPDFSALAAEIALQRTHLEVSREIGLDSLRCGDGP